MFDIKYMILILSLVAILAIAGCTNFIPENTEPAENKTCEGPVMPDFYSKGSVKACDFTRFEEPNGESLIGCGIVEDFCPQPIDDPSGLELYESWCEGNRLQRMNFKCPNGCRDGACIPPSGPQIVPNITETELRSLNQSECSQNGFEWAPVPGLCYNEQGEYDCGFRCDIRTNDYGKNCYSNGDCEGACLCGGNYRDSEGFVVGRCSKYLYYTEAIDCPCVLETKSLIETYQYCS